MQVWSGMCALLEGAIERYEHQTRLSQQFHSKFLRLVTHSEDKLSRLSRENEELRAEIRELRAELSGKSSAVTALTREVRYLLCACAHSAFENFAECFNLIF